MFVNRKCSVQNVIMLTLNNSRMIYAGMCIFSTEYEYGICPKMARSLWCNCFPERILLIVQTVYCSTGLQMLNDHYFATNDRFLNYSFGFNQT